jgi:hypothetical protein
LYRFDPPLSIALGVQNQAFSERTAFVGDYIEEVLEGINGLAFLSDKQSGFLSSNIHSYEFARVIDIYAALEANSGE